MGYEWGRLFAAPRVAGVARFSQMASEASEVLRPSKRIRVTDEPCIVAMQRMLRGKQGILSLAQGIVFWKPPEEATEAARRAAQEPDTNSYGDDDGMPSLRAALKEKLRKENALEGVEVMVTAGANQAYTNLVCALLDEKETLRCCSDPSISTIGWLCR
ncbi:unnamed protein product [Effrenium voratum]|nr:unnamed protein product [Effrenium voratum]